MEILAIVLSGLFSLTSGGGIVLDSVAANQISSQIGSHKHAIRIDNTPNYQIAGGKIQKVRIAARDVTLKPDLNIAVLELETDRVHFFPNKLKIGSINEFRESLQQPFQGAVTVVLSEADLNQALQSPEIVLQLQKTLNRLISRRGGSTNLAYQLLDVEISLHSTNRLGLKFKLARPLSSFERDSSVKIPNPNRELSIALDLKIEILNGKTVSITEPEGTVNDRPMSSRLLNGFAEGISDRLNLATLEADGILARILQLKINDDKLKLVGFVKVETKATQLSSKEVKAIP